MSITALPNGVSRRCSQPPNAPCPISSTLSGRRFVPSRSHAVHADVPTRKHSDRLGGSKRAHGHGVDAVLRAEPCRLEKLALCCDSVALPAFRAGRDRKEDLEGRVSQQPSRKHLSEHPGRCWAVCRRPRADELFAALPNARCKHGHDDLFDDRAARVERPCPRLGLVLDHLRLFHLFVTDCAVGVACLCPRIREHGCILLRVFDRVIQHSRRGRCRAREERRGHASERRDRRATRTLHPNLGDEFRLWNRCLCTRSRAPRRHDSGAKRRERGRRDGLAKEMVR